MSEYSERRSFTKRQAGGTSSDNEWERVVQGMTTSDNEWYNERTGDIEWQRVTKNDSEWQRMTRSDKTNEYEWE